jgi:hypothetical protein
MGKPIFGPSPKLTSHSHKIGMIYYVANVQIIITMGGVGNP